MYLNVVPVATYPDSYEDRLTEIYARTFRHLRFDGARSVRSGPHDVTCNADRDRGDVEYLATAVPSIWLCFANATSARCANT